MKLAFGVLFATVVWAHGCSGFIGKTASAGKPVDPEYPTVEVLLLTHANAKNP